MKTFKLILIAVFLITTSITKAQDVIVKKDNSTILSKVTRISEAEIEYKKWSNLDGPTYTLNIAEIVSINYQNGEIEYFSNKPESPTNNQVTTNQQSETINQKTDVPTNGLMKRSGKYLTLDGRVLSDDEVLELVGYENYQTYHGAQGQWRGGTIFAGLCVLSIAGIIAGITSLQAFDDPSDMILLTIVSSGATIITFPLMCVFYGISKSKLNWVAYEYNKQHNSSMSFSVAPSLLKCEMPQLQNNYGLGLTFSMKF